MINSGASGGAGLITGLTQVSGGADDSGRGGRPVAPGAARDLGVALSADQANLILTLTPNDAASYSVGVNYVVYWLDPTIFSQSDIYAQQGSGVITNNGMSVIQARQFVTNMPGGDGVITAIVPYQPLSATPGVPTGYATGGWMYAVVLPVGSAKEARLSGTNFVAVPVVGGAGEPSAAEVPRDLLVTRQTISGSLGLVQFSWTNAATLITTSYIQITGVNYWNDGRQRNFATFKINTKPGAKQGTPDAGLNLSGTSVSSQQAIILETDAPSGAHNIDWYFVPLSFALTPLHLTASPKYTTAGI